MNDHKIQKLDLDFWFLNNFKKTLSLPGGCYVFSNEMIKKNKWNMTFKCSKKTYPFEFSISSILDPTFWIIFWQFVIPSFVKSIKSMNSFNGKINLETEPKPNVPSRNRTKKNKNIFWCHRLLSTLNYFLENSVD